MKKFDCVVGNPPYQDTTSKNTIYPIFYKKVTGLVAAGGLIALITPTAIIKGLAGQKVDKMPMPSMLNPILINITDIKKAHFTGVGSSFCYFIVQNAPYANTTELITDWGVTTIKFDGRVPNSDNVVLAASIMSKCFGGANVYGVTTSDVGKKSPVSNVGDVIAVRTINSDKTIDTLTVDISNKQHPLLNRPKVMMTILGRKAIVDYTHNYVPSAHHLIATVLTNSNAESESFMSLLDSKLERYHEKILNNKDNCWYYNFSRVLSAVPLNRIWTDAELYAHFNLTQEEIDLIESTVK